MRSSDSMSQERNPDGLRHLRLQLIFGASGAVSSSLGFGLDDLHPPVQSANPGQYTITIDRAVAKLVGYSTGWKRASAAAALEWDLITDNSGTTGALVFESKVAAGTLTNPANGDILFLTLTIDEMGQ